MDAPNSKLMCGIPTGAALKKSTDMALTNLWENLGLPRQTKCNELFRIELNYFMIDSAHRSASTEPQTKLS